MSDTVSAHSLGQCPYMRRTSVIMADGEVVTCANFYAENAGHLATDGSLSAVWNGGRLTSLRAAFGTEAEWDQCRSCWFREVGYAEQRTAWHRKDEAIIDKTSRYSERAWSFLRFLKGVD